MGSFVADFPTFATKCALFIQNAIDLNEGYPHAVYSKRKISECLPQRYIYTLALFQCA